MLNVDPHPYRWEDHVIPPHSVAASLTASALIVLAIGAGMLLAGVRTPPPVMCLLPPPVAHIVVTERTPPLSELARRRPLPRPIVKDWL